MRHKFQPNAGSSGRFWCVVASLIAKLMGPTLRPTWVLSAPDGPHVGPMNLAIRDVIVKGCILYVLIILMCTSFVLQQNITVSIFSILCGTSSCRVAIFFIFIAQTADDWTLFAMTNTFYVCSAVICQNVSPKTRQSSSNATRDITFRSDKM